MLFDMLALRLCNKPAGVDWALLSQLLGNRPVPSTVAALSACGDADGDGFSNAEEWLYFDWYCTVAPGMTRLRDFDGWVSLARWEVFFADTAIGGYWSVPNFSGWENSPGVPPTVTVTIVREGDGGSVSPPPGDCLLPQYNLTDWWVADAGGGFVPRADRCASCEPAGLVLHAAGTAQWVFDKWSLLELETDDGTVSIALDEDKLAVAEFLPVVPGMETDLADDLVKVLEEIQYDSTKFDYDHNGVGIVDGEFGLAENGIPDMAEFDLLQAVLRDPRVDYAWENGVVHYFLRRTWEQNLALFSTQYPALTDHAKRVLAAYMTIGNTGSVMQCNYLLGGLGYQPLAPESGYVRDHVEFLADYGDANADGMTNLEQWEAVVEECTEFITRDAYRQYAEWALARVTNAGPSMQTGPIAQTTSGTNPTAPDSDYCGVEYVNLIVPFSAPAGATVSMDVPTGLTPLGTILKVQASRVAPNGFVFDHWQCENNPLHWSIDENDEFMIMGNSNEPDICRAKAAYTRAVLSVDKWDRTTFSGIHVEYGALPDGVEIIEETGEKWVFAGPGSAQIHFIAKSDAWGSGAVVWTNTFSSGGQPTFSWDTRDVGVRLYAGGSVKVAVIPKDPKTRCTHLVARPAKGGQVLIGSSDSRAAFSTGIKIPDPTQLIPGTEEYQPTFNGWIKAHPAPNYSFFCWNGAEEYTFYRNPEFDISEYHIAHYVTSTPKAEFRKKKHSRFNISLLTVGDQKLTKSKTPPGYVLLDPARTYYMPGEQVRITAVAYSPNTVGDVQVGDNVVPNGSIYTVSQHSASVVDINVAFTTGWTKIPLPLPDVTYESSLSKLVTGALAKLGSLLPACLVPELQFSLPLFETWWAPCCSHIDGEEVSGTQTKTSITGGASLGFGPCWMIGGGAPPEPIHLDGVGTIALQLFGGLELHGDICGNVALSLLSNQCTNCPDSYLEHGDLQLTLTGGATLGTAFAVTFTRGTDTFAVDAWNVSGDAQISGKITARAYVEDSDCMGELKYCSMGTLDPLTLNLYVTVAGFGIDVPFQFLSERTIGNCP